MAAIHAQSQGRRTGTAEKARTNLTRYWSRNWIALGLNGALQTIAGFLVGWLAALGGSGAAL